MMHTIMGAYPTNIDYLISIDGTILKKNWNKSRRTKAIKISNQGNYKCFNNNGKLVLVHRAMADTFPINGIGVLVCHRNDVADDNRIENLYRGDHSSNLYDAYRNKVRPNMKGRPAHNKGQGRPIEVNYYGVIHTFTSLGLAGEFLGISSPSSVQRLVRLGGYKNKNIKMRYIENG